MTRPPFDTMEITGYHIDKIIGQGGMAIVYRAVQKALHRPVALKILHAEYAADTDFARHFLEEGRTAARLNDPQIVTVHDTGVDNGHYYLAMEYLPGGTLQRRIKEGLSLERALGIAERIGRGLAYAHSRNIIHCDIKPNNILFRASGDPVITDFGIARPTSQSHWSGQNLASPRYMSPEQARNEPLDARSDLYSLGIILYEMLTGYPPYDAKDPLALAKLHLQAPIPRLPTGIAEFQPLIDQLLAKVPDQRYTITEQFLDTLEQCQRTHWLNRHGGTMPMPVLDEDVVTAPMAYDQSPDATRQLHRPLGAGATAATGEPPPVEPAADKIPKATWHRKSASPVSDKVGSRSRPVWLLATIPVVLIGLAGGGYWWLQTTPPQSLPTRIVSDPGTTDDPAPAPTTAEELAESSGIGPPSVIPETIDEPLPESEPTVPEEIATRPEPVPSPITATEPAPQTPEPEPIAPPTLTEPSVTPSIGDDLETIRQLITNGDYSRSLAMLDRTLSEMPDNQSLRDLRRQLRIQQILKQANDLREHGRLEDALTVIDQGLDEYPEESTLQVVQEEITTFLRENRIRAQADLHLQRARDLYNRDQLDEALAEIEQGLQLLPRHAELRILRAQISVDQSSFD